jgi:hypothetical protein
MHELKQKFAARFLLQQLTYRIESCEFEIYDTFYMR